MRTTALAVALFAIAVGLVGLVSPESLVTVGRYVVTPVGLYAVTALRVGIGLLLMLVAPISRAPRTLRVFGAIVLLAGLTTPLLGVDRVRAILEWEAIHIALVRASAVGALAAGGFIAFAVTGGRRLHSGARA
jgi:hypothetical protein